MITLSKQSLLAHSSYHSIQIPPLFFPLQYLQSSAYNHKMLEEEAEWIKQTLREAERSQRISKVLGVDHEDAVAKGNNFVSDIYRLRMKTVTYSGEIRNRSLIYKVIPANQEGKLEDIKKSGLFTKEIRMYTEVLPALERLLLEVDPGGECLWPKMYGYKQDHEGFIMEDVSVLGYKMADRVKGLDETETKVALTSLARFHALGAVAIARGKIIPDDFDVYHFNKEAGKLEEIYEGLSKSLIKVIEEKWKGEWLELVDNLKVLLKSMPEQLRKLGKRDESTFNTFNHGDFWLNNVLFHRLPDGSPQKIKMVDFQLAFYNNPCFDVHYLLSTSLRTEFEDRKEHLLGCYHSALERNLKLLGYSREIPTLEFIKESYNRLTLFAFSVSICFRPFMTIESIMTLKKEHPEIERSMITFLCYSYGGDHIEAAVKQAISKVKQLGFI